MTRHAPAVVAELVVLAVAAIDHRLSPLHLIPALVLSPAAVEVTRRAAGRLAGDRFGLGAAWVYVALPALGYVYFLAEFRHTFVHGAVPELVGLRAPWLLLVSIAAAAAVAVLPQAISATAGIAAVVVAFAVWRLQGFADVRSGIHESGWSPTLLAWLVVAGLIGMAARSPRLAAALGGWVIAVLVVAERNGYGDGAIYWRSLAAATPAIAILLTSLWSLVPRLRPARRPVQPDAH